MGNEPKNQAYKAKDFRPHIFDEIEMSLSTLGQYDYSLAVTTDNLKAILAYVSFLEKFLDLATKEKE